MTKKRTPRLDALLDRVEAVVKNKSALGRELGVSPTHIQNWITSRRYEPGGEITLHLLEWVTAEEGKQQNAPGNASNTARDLTRLQKHSHETYKTSPKRGKQKGSQ